MSTAEPSETDLQQIQVIRIAKRSPGSVKAAPVDPRFASTVDQYKYCWSSYNEMLRCWSKKGFKAAPCTEYENYAKNICPSDQLKQFYESRRDDKWYGYNYPMQEAELQEGDVITKREKHDHGHH